MEHRTVRARKCEPTQQSEITNQLDVAMFTNIIRTLAALLLALLLLGALDFTLTTYCNRPTRIMRTVLLIGHLFLYTCLVRTVTGRTFNNWMETETEWLRRRNRILDHSNRQLRKHAKRANKQARTIRLKHVTKLIEPLSPRKELKQQFALSLITQAARAVGTFGSDTFLRAKARVSSIFGWNLLTKLEQARYIIVVMGSARGRTEFGIHVATFIGMLITVFSVSSKKGRVFAAAGCISPLLAINNLLTPWVSIDARVGVLFSQLRDLVMSDTANPEEKRAARRLLGLNVYRNTGDPARMSRLFNRFADATDKLAGRKNRVKPQPEEVFQDASSLFEELSENEDEPSESESDSDDEEEAYVADPHTTVQPGLDNATVYLTQEERDRALHKAAIEHVTKRYGEQFARSPLMIAEEDEDEEHEGEDPDPYGPAPVEDDTSFACHMQDTDATRGRRKGGRGRRYKLSAASFAARHPRRADTRFETPHPWARGEVDLSRTHCISNSAVKRGGTTEARPRNEGFHLNGGSSQQLPPLSAVTNLLAHAQEVTAEIANPSRAPLVQQRKPAPELQNVHRNANTDSANILLIAAGFLARMLLPEGINDVKTFIADASGYRSAMLDLAHLFGFDPLGHLADQERGITLTAEIDEHCCSWKAGQDPEPWLERASLLREEGNVLADRLTAQGRQSNQLNAALSNISKLKQEISTGIVSHDSRMVPVGIYLRSDYGHGKTTFLHEYFFPALHKMIGSPEVSDKVYSLNGAGNFASTIAGERFYFLDEFAATDKDTTKRVTDSLTTLLSSQPMIMETAGMAGKQQQPEPFVVAVASNLTIGAGAQLAGMQSPAALASRFFCFEVRDCDYDPSKRREQQDHRKPDFSHLRFFPTKQITDGGDVTEIKPIPFASLLKPGKLKAHKCWDPDCPYEAMAFMTGEDLVRLTYREIVKSLERHERVKHQARASFKPGDGQAATLVAKYLKRQARVVPTLSVLGPPGTGKTQMLKQLTPRFVRIHTKGRYDGIHLVTKDTEPRSLRQVHSKILVFDDIWTNQAGSDVLLKDMIDEVTESCAVLVIANLIKRRSWLGRPYIETRSQTYGMARRLGLDFIDTDFETHTEDNGTLFYVKKTGLEIVKTASPCPWCQPLIRPMDFAHSWGTGAGWESDLIDCCYIWMNMMALIYWRIWRYLWHELVFHVWNRGIYSIKKPRAAQLGIEVCKEFAHQPEGVLRVEHMSDQELQSMPCDVSVDVKTSDVPASAIPSIIRDLTLGRDNAYARISFVGNLSRTTALQALKDFPVGGSPADIARHLRSRASTLRALVRTPRITFYLDGPGNRFASSAGRGLQVYAMDDARRFHQVWVECRGERDPFPISKVVRAALGDREGFSSLEEEMLWDLQDNMEALMTALDVPAIKAVYEVLHERERQRERVSQKMDYLKVGSAIAGGILLSLAAYGIYRYVQGKRKKVNPAQELELNADKLLLQQFAELNLQRGNNVNRRNRRPQQSQPSRQTHRQVRHEDDFLFYDADNQRINPDGTPRNGPIRPDEWQDYINDRDAYEPGWRGRAMGGRYRNTIWDDDDDRYDGAYLAQMMQRRRKQEETHAAFTATAKDRAVEVQYEAAVLQQQGVNIADPTMRAVKFADAQTVLVAGVGYTFGLFINDQLCLTVDHNVSNEKGPLPVIKWEALDGKTGGTMEVVWRSSNADLALCKTPQSQQGFKNLTPFFMTERELAELSVYTVVTHRQRIKREWMNCTSTWGLCRDSSSLFLDSTGTLRMGGPVGVVSLGPAHYVKKSHLDGQCGTRFYLYDVDQGQPRIGGLHFGATFTDDKRRYDKAYFTCITAEQVRGWTQRLQRQATTAETPSAEPVEPWTDHVQSETSELDRQIMTHPAVITGVHRRGDVPRSLTIPDGAANFRNISGHFGPGWRPTRNPHMLDLHVHKTSMTWRTDVERILGTATKVPALPHVQLSPQQVKLLEIDGAGLPSQTWTRMHKGTTQKRMSSTLKAKLIKTAKDLGRYCHEIFTMAHKAGGPPIRELSEYEALNGCPEFGVPPMRTLTSAGAFWASQGAPMKRQLFEVDDKGKLALADPRKRSDDVKTLFARSYVRTARMLNAGKNPRNLFQECLKAELLAPEKSHKPRIFSIAPPEDNIRLKMKLGMIHECFKTCRHLLPMQIGMNPLLELDYHVHAATAYSEDDLQCIAADVDGNDRRFSEDDWDLVAEVLATIFEEEGMARTGKAIRNHFNALKVRTHIVGNCLVEIKGGHPSGLWGTFLYNCLPRAVEIIAFARERKPSATVGDVLDRFHTLLGGDDILIFVPPCDREWFNFFTLKKFMEECGALITPDTKDNKERALVPLAEATFLSRFIVPHTSFAGPAVMAGALRMASLIGSFTHTNRATLPWEHELMGNRLEEGLLEFAAHGIPALKKFIDFRTEMTVKHALRITHMPASEVMGLLINKIAIRTRQLNTSIALVNIDAPAVAETDLTKTELSSIDDEAQPSILVQQLALDRDMSFPSLKRMTGFVKGILPSLDGWDDTNKPPEQRFFNPDMSLERASLLLTLGSTNWTNWSSNTRGPEDTYPLSRPDNIALWLLLHELIVAPEDRVKIPAYITLPPKPRAKLLMPDWMPTVTKEFVNTMNKVAKCTARGQDMRETGMAGYGKDGKNLTLGEFVAVWELNHPIAEQGKSPLNTDHTAEIVLSPNKLITASRIPNLDEEGLQRAAEIGGRRAQEVKLMMSDEHPDVAAPVTATGQAGLATGTNASMAVQAVATHESFAPMFVATPMGTSLLDLAHAGASNNIIAQMEQWQIVNNGSWTVNTAAGTVLMDLKVNPWNSSSVGLPISRYAALHNYFVGGVEYRLRISGNGAFSGYVRVGWLPPGVNPAIVSLSHLSISGFESISISSSGECAIGCALHSNNQFAITKDLANSNGNPTGRLVIMAETAWTGAFSQTSSVSFVLEARLWQSSERGIVSTFAQPSTPARDALDMDLRLPTPAGLQFFGLGDAIMVLDGIAPDLGMSKALLLGASRRVPGSKLMGWHDFAVTMETKTGSLADMSPFFAFGLEHLDARSNRLPNFYATNELVSEYQPFEIFDKEMDVGALNYMNSRLPRTYNAILGNTLVGDVQKKIRIEGHFLCSSTDGPRFFYNTTQGALYPDWLGHRSTRFSQLKWDYAAKDSSLVGTAVFQTEPIEETPPGEEKRAATFEPEIVTHQAWLEGAYNSDTAEYPYIYVSFKEGVHPLEPTDQPNPNTQLYKRFDKMAFSQDGRDWEYVRMVTGNLPGYSFYWDAEPGVEVRDVDIRNIKWRYSSFEGSQNRDRWLAQQGKVFGPVHTGWLSSGVRCRDPKAVVCVASPTPWGTMKGGARSVKFTNDLMLVEEVDSVTDGPAMEHAPGSRAFFESLAEACPPTGSVNFDLIMTSTGKRFMSCSFDFVNGLTARVDAAAPRHMTSNVRGNNLYITNITKSTQLFGIASSDVSEWNNLGVPAGMGMSYMIRDGAVVMRKKPPRACEYKPSKPATLKQQLGAGAVIGGILGGVGMGIGNVASMQFQQEMQQNLFRQQQTMQGRAFDQERRMATLSSALMVDRYRTMAGMNHQAINANALRAARGMPPVAPARPVQIANQNVQIARPAAGNP